MRVGVRVETEGLDKCKDAFSGTVLGGEFEDIVDAAALLIEGSAKGYAAVDTGYMRDSIFHETGSEWNSAAARITSPAPYSKYVEFGTSKMAAQPFMAPAFYENWNKIIKMFEDGAVNALLAAFKG